MSSEPELRALPTIGPRVLAFRRHLRAEVVVGKGAYLISERGTTRLRGAHVEAVAPLLDGTRDLPSLLREAGDRASAAEIGELLGSLSAAGLVSYRPADQPGRDPRAEAFWELAGLDGTSSSDRVGAAQVRILAVGRDDEATVRPAFEAAGLRCVSSDSPTAAELTVVVCDDYLAPVLRRIDLAQRAAGRPWLIAKPTGSVVWSGPVLTADGGACWQCLAHRLRANRVHELTVQHALGMAEPPLGPEASLGATRALGLQLAALQAAKWLAGQPGPQRQEIHTLDTLGLRAEQHAVLRRPQCATCGTPGAGAARMLEPVVLRPARKVSTTGNGHRHLTPQQVLDRYGHLVSPISGVVQAITRAEAPALLHSYTARTCTVPDGRAPLRRESGGKGATELDARVSALCEALERESGRLHGDEPRVRDSLRGLGEIALHPNRCQLYHERQYRDRARWNTAHGSYQRVAEPLDERTPIDWTPVWSLTGGRRRLLPTSMLFYGAHPSDEGVRHARADSNGCAAGGTLEDAVLQGFLELVERDAVALWWYNRTRQPAVDLASLGDPWIDEVARLHRREGRELWALDLTADLGVPVVAALSRRVKGPTEDILFGFGAHYDFALAVRRAVAEVNQLLPAVAPAVPGGPPRYSLKDPAALHWWRSATVARHPYLLPDREQRAVRPRERPSLAGTDLRADVETAGELVRRHGMELLVLDQTRLDIGLPVVRVIVPGLRHFWARFAPGRLYDVPVRLGRLAEPTPYERLNPVPLFV
ncbi:TOMM precursor leader peptide-binding protein [Kitasatospora sp. NPDC094015]|uniref:TOMM precursor leader peptide-binding protein n=1 Tax=Kitasatospora sp. NPDC094015 TaxID=3155205 RepID=UPI003333D4B2